MITDTRGYPAKYSLDEDKVLVVERVATLQNQVRVLTDGQVAMKEAIIKLAENMTFMQRLEKRVMCLESKTNKMIGGLIFVSVVMPIVVTALVTAVLFYLGN